MTEAGFTQLMTLISVVGTGVGTMLVQIYREGRRHRWEVEERARVAQALKEQVHQDAATLATKVLTDARELAHDTLDKALATSDERTAQMQAVAVAVLKGQAELAARIEHERNNRKQANLGLHAAINGTLVAIHEAKDAADASYTEANHVNKKISDLNQRLLTATTEPEKP